jgi:hypothetical protein
MADTTISSLSSSIIEGQEAVNASLIPLTYITPPSPIQQSSYSSSSSSSSSSSAAAVDVDVDVPPSDASQQLSSASLKRKRSREEEDEVDIEVVNEVQIPKKAAPEFSNAINGRGKPRMKYTFVNIKTALLKYKEINGDLMIKKRFIIPTESAEWPEEVWGMKLGSIVINIRYIYIHIVTYVYIYSCICIIINDYSYMNIYLLFSFYTLYTHIYIYIYIASFSRPSGKEMDIRISKRNWQL